MYGIDDQPAVDLKLQSPFYRGAVKVLVFDDKRRLLVTQTDEQLWEMPGGGWEHDEDMEDCVRREIREELGVGVAHIGPIEFAYRGINQERGHIALRLVVQVVLENHSIQSGDNMIAAKFVDKSEFMDLPMARDEATVKKYADRIWSLVEK